jgi:hypothetical protein
MVSHDLSSPRIPIDTCEGLFEKVKWEYKELELDWNEHRSFNFVVTAYHLYNDWFKSAGTREQKQRLNKLPDNAIKLFKTLRDITNASKHFKLELDAQKKQIVTDVSTPVIAGWHAYLVTGPVIYITVDNARLSMPELASLTLECLTWILQGNPPDFPQELIDRLEMVYRPLQ